MLRLVAIFFSVLAFAQAPPGTDRLVEDILHEWKVPGLALGIVQNGVVVHQKGYGLRDVDKNLPATTKTAFAYGSITKSLTVLLLHSLAAEGKLDWDAPVRDQLPGFKLSDPVASERATPRDLVTHRTGMPRHDAIWSVPDPPSQDEILARLRYLPASADFRTKYQYNNLMFMAAGMLAARASSSPWEQAVRRRVFDPLELGDIAATHGEADALPDVALSYNLLDSSFRKLRVTPGLKSIAPAGAAFGSIESLTRYLLVQINHGRVNGRQALPASFFQQMQSPHTPTPATGSDSPFTAQQAYGMGLTIGRYQGRTMIYHTGSIGGYHAMLWWLPEDKIGIAILLNRLERAVPHILCLTLADRMIGIPPKDWNAVYKKGTQPPSNSPKPVPGTQPSHALAHYAGRYTHPGYGLVTVEETPDGLSFIRSGDRRTLTHFHYDTFAAFGDRVTFHTGAEGVVSTLEIRLEPAVAPILFTRSKQERAPSTQ
ncbi:MAG: serine hydrolase [Acidobacteria bacterium]|nr:serine hydrolase [Acidobacteriota bacterium]